nr:four-carbon acid sugar kinase family protein [Jiangella mangrovi]
MADDLTGAAEAAAAFVARTPRILDLRTARVARTSRGARDLFDGGDVVAVDTDSRYATPTTAAERTTTALALLPPGGVVVKKLDSTLRGPIAAELAALREPGGALVVAPALPALGRTVVGGAVLVGGVPLERSGAWAAESRPAPSSLAEALAPLPVTVVELPVVRGGMAELADALRSAADAGRVAVCDAETEADLDRIVAAGESVRRSGQPVRWAGSAGLAHAIARAHAADARATRAPAPAPAHGGPAHGEPARGGPDEAVPPGAAVTEVRIRTVPPARGSLPVPPPLGPILFVVGTAAPAAREQLGWLKRHIGTVVELDPEQLAEPAVAAAHIAERTAGRTAAVHLADARGAARSPDVAAALARAVAPAALDHPALVLTGGETARAVLAALEVGELHVREAWADGVVVSTEPGGRVIVTKPGAFGEPRTLVHIVQRLPGTRWHLRATSPAAATHQHSPHQEDT